MTPAPTPAATGIEARPRVLLVDDEPAILQGLKLQLSRLYDVTCATNGPEALQQVSNPSPFAILMTDMRMPGMDGAALLQEARQRSPHTVRLLLTGYSDIRAAISAVNEGRVFRFLTKPCAPEVLKRSFADALEQHRLLCSEQELLARTVRGAVLALAEVLALVEPAAYGRALRIQRLCLAMAEHLGLQPRWPLELAALLCPIGEIGVPADTLIKRNAGKPLSTTETAALARATEVTDKLLTPIPRLEPVRDILRAAARSPGGSAALSGSADLVRTLAAARLLRLVQDFDALESRGYSSSESLGLLRQETVTYEPKLLEALAHCASRQKADGFEMRELPVSLLRPGMVLVEELRTHSGQLLAPRGYPITATFQARAQNFPEGHIREPVRVMLSESARTTPAP